MNIAFTLAPTSPPKLQLLRIAGIGNMSSAMLAAAGTEAARTPYGTCRIKQTLGGDGASTTSLLLDCEPGPVHTIGCLNVFGNTPAR